MRGLLADGGFVLEGEGADLALVGALAGYSAPIGADAEARDALQARLAVALKENQSSARAAALIAALERASAGLYAAGRDAEGESFAKALRLAFRRNPKTELGQRFERRLWPPAPGIELRDLAREEARFEVPPSL